MQKGKEMDEGKKGKQKRGWGQGGGTKMDSKRAWQKQGRQGWGTSSQDEQEVRFLKRRRS